MESIMDFIKARLKERTSLDGAALIAICVALFYLAALLR